MLTTSAAGAVRTVDEPSMPNISKRTRHGQAVTKLEERREMAVDAGVLEAEHPNAKHLDMTADCDCMRL